MINITSDGDLSFISESLRLFSDSSEREFLFIFRANKDCNILCNMLDKGLFTAEKYCCLEFNVKFLRDFFYSFDIGDFYVEVMNVAHHENN